MEKILELFLIHSWLVFWITICGGFIIGNLGKKYYYSKFNFDKYIFPDANEEFFVKLFRGIFYAALPLGLLAYLYPLFHLLT